MPAPFFHPLPFLAQAPAPWDDSPPPPAAPPAQHRMNFSDLQQSIHDYDTGKNNDKAFRNAFLVLLAVIAVITLLMHLRERRKNASAPNSLHRLSRELSRAIRFPVAARWMLVWVARSTKTPFASLLLCAGLYDKCVADWSARPTFSVARRWGRSRLDRLRDELFT